MKQAPPEQKLIPNPPQIKNAMSQYIPQPQQRQQQSNISQLKVQQQEQHNKIEESHCIRVMSKEIKYAEKMQLWFKGKQCQKQYQKIKKKYRYRNNVLAEIVNTERTFVNDVTVICEKVKTTCSQVLQKQDIETIFMNIDEILKWNKQFLQILEDSYAKYNKYKAEKGLPKPYQMVFDGIANLIENDSQAFKCYYEYCSGFTTSNKTFEQFKANNQAFKDYLAQLNKSGSLRGMDLASFLVKPVQRLPKYILLFKDLEKNTDDYFPDLKNIKYIHKYFRDVNEENNKSMDIFMGRLQLQELCESLKIDKEELLFEQTRVYRFEEKLTIIHPNAKKDEDCQVVIHALSDMIIVLHDDKVQKKIKLDSLSFVKDQSENNKYFSNLFQIVGAGDTLQCIAETAIAKKKYISQFEKLIQENREQEHEKEKQSGITTKMRYPVQVVVIGTEERNFQSFTKHTQYITEISISKVSQNIFIRYSDIQNLSTKYNKRYPKIDLPELPDKNWLMSHKTKQIEARKIAIENFLQALLQAKEVQQDQEILSELKLPKEFFDLPELDQAHLSQIRSQKKYLSKTTQEWEAELREKGIIIEKLKTSAGEILKAIQIERASRKRSVVQIRPNIVRKFDPHTCQDLKKVMITFPDGTETALGVTEQTRVSEVLEFVAKHNHLIYYQDFRLYIIDKLKKQRVLDGDEVLYKVIKDEETSDSIFSKIEQILARSNPEVIIKLKKYIYLPARLEEQDYKEDTVRLINLAFSILDDVHDQKLQLGFKEYCLFSALYFHMKHQRIDDQLFGEILRVVPAEMYKSSTEKEWKDLVYQCYKALENELEQISKKNLHDKEQKKPNSAYKHTDKKYLAAGVTLNAARTFVQSQMAIFQVQVYEGTQKLFKNGGMEVHPTIYLGFSIHKVHFLNPQRKEKFREFDYSRIKGVKSYPSQIIFDLDIFKEPIRFDTYQSYEIKQLVEQYQEIQKFDEEYALGHQFSKKQ